MCEAMSRLFETEGWNNFRLWYHGNSQVHNGHTFLVICLILVGAFWIGSALGHDDGYRIGHNVGYSEGKNEVCPLMPTLSPSEETPMNFSSFLDWAGKVELPPIGWALLIFLAVVMLK